MFQTRFLFLKQVPGFETYRNPTAQNLTTLLLTVGHLTVLRPVVSEAFVHILVNKRVTVLYEPFVLTLTARQCESPGSTGWLASPNCQKRERALRNSYPRTATVLFTGEEPVSLTVPQNLDV